MRSALTIKFFLAMLGVAAFAVLSTSIAARVSFSRDFFGYLGEQEMQRLRDAVPPIEAAYKEHGNWEFLQGGDPRVWFHLLRPSNLPENPTREDLARISVSDLIGVGGRFTLLDGRLKYIAGNVTYGSRDPRLPITVDGKVVGWLGMLPFRQVTAAGDLRFQRSQYRSTWIIALSAIVLAALLATWITRTLMAPVLRITRATHALAKGDLDTRIDVRSRDELGTLSRDFNQLAMVLERNERMRREFVADVSHELRTPLAIMRGELEAIEDGVRPMSPEAVKSLQGEVSALSKLVDDLYQLSLADVGTLRFTKVAIDLTALIHSLADSYRPRFAVAGIALELKLPLLPMLLEADEGRLSQLFANLFENTLRYTDAGGCLRIDGEESSDRVTVNVMDSAPGVGEESLPRLFDRFYREESSRNRSTGGSGLGLAISRTIVEAHGGFIEARPSPLGGLWLRIQLLKHGG